ncbi:MAG: BTAD domain-containing putative transcriptional regulator, partial [Burkholderiales bacterium]
LDTGRVKVDAAEFEALIAAKNVTSLTEAAALYKGEFLAGLSTDAPDFEDWLATSRGHYRDLALRGLVDLIEHRRNAGQLDLAAQTANQALRIDPYREDIHRWLMRLLAARGLRAAALAQYRECESILRRELGVSPDDETIRLHERLLARREAPSTIAAAKVDQTQSAEAADAPPFVGREAELSELAQNAIRASEHGTRLAVISGEAGVGKSRLIEKFIEGPTLQAWSIIRIRARAAERLLAFGLWAELLNSRVLEGPEGPAVSQSLARRLAFVRGGPGAWDRRGRGAVVDHPYVFDAMVELLHSRSGGNNLLLVIEDLHFADTASQRLLFYVVRNLRRAPVFVVASVRQDPVAQLPDAVRDLEQDGLLDHVPLRPLTRSKTVE